LYASGFNGFTKELGSWSELQKTITIQDSLMKTKKGDVFGILVAWVPSVFANQTSIWPDVRVIAENETLKEENNSLRDSLKHAYLGSDVDTSDLMNANIKWLKEIAILEEEIAKLQQAQSNNQNPNTDDAVLKENQRLLKEISGLTTKYDNLMEQFNSMTDENNKFKVEYTKLQEENRKLKQDNKCETITKQNEQLNSLIKTLQDRISSFNARQRNWTKASKKDFKSIKEQVNSAMKDTTYYNFLFLTPIETK
jgi:DNA repair exonuclease SbcCD ATPase subunit